MLYIEWLIFRVPVLGLLLVLPLLLYAPLDDEVIELGPLHVLDVELVKQAAVLQKGERERMFAPVYYSLGEGASVEFTVFAGSFFALGVLKRQREKKGARVGDGVMMACAGVTPLLHTLSCREKNRGRRMFPLKKSVFLPRRRTS